MLSFQQTETATRDEQRNEIVPNGTHPLTVSLERVDSPYARRLRSSDAPRINTSIFDNITLTPSKISGANFQPRVATPLGTPNIQARTATPLGSPKAVPKAVDYYGAKKKIFVDKVLIPLRKFAVQCRSRLPDWKIILASFLVAMVVAMCIYVYFYHSEAVVDYATITYQGIRKKFQGEERKELKGEEL